MRIARKMQKFMFWQLKRRLILRAARGLQKCGDVRFMYFCPKRALFFEIYLIFFEKPIALFADTPYHDTCKYKKALTKEVFKND